MRVNTPVTIAISTSDRENRRKAFGSSRCQSTVCLGNIVGKFHPVRQTNRLKGGNVVARDLPHGQPAETGTAEPRISATSVSSSFSNANGLVRMGWRIPETRRL